MSVLSNYLLYICMKTLESPLDWKEILPVNPKGNQSWIVTEKIDAQAETPIFWPPDAKSWLRPWCWERVKAGEADNRGRDSWMASLTQWTWVWASSGRWWRTGKAGVLQSMGSQRVGHNWATEQLKSLLFIWSLYLLGILCFIWPFQVRAIV